MENINIAFNFVSGADLVGYCLMMVAVFFGVVAIYKSRQGK